MCGNAVRTGRSPANGGPKAERQLPWGCHHQHVLCECGHGHSHNLCLQRLQGRHQQPDQVPSLPLVFQLRIYPSLPFSPFTLKATYILALARFRASLLCHLSISGAVFAWDLFIGWQSRLSTVIASMQADMAENKGTEREFWQVHGNLTCTPQHPGECHRAWQHHDGSPSAGCRRQSSHEQARCLPLIRIPDFKFKSQMQFTLKAPTTVGPALLIHVLLHKKLQP